MLYTTSVVVEPGCEIVIVVADWVTVKVDPSDVEMNVLAGCVLTTVDPSCVLVIVW